jgi:predicted outer membrane repeat protein
LYNWIGNDPILTNVTFSGNTADLGGAIGNYQSSPVLSNVTFSNNAASSYGGGIYNESNSNPIVQNTILWGNSALNGSQIYNDASTPIINDSVVQGGYIGGANIIATDPMLGALGNYGGITATVPLFAGSSAIDTGNDANCTATDQRGITRPQGLHCDIGAFEYVAPATPTPTDTPTATPVPTKTPHPTKTPKPTKTPRS